MKNKLLEKALQIPRQRKVQNLRLSVTEEECEMFVEMIKGRLTTRQYVQALGFPSNPGYVASRAISVLRCGIEKGWLSLKFNPRNVKKDI